MNLLSSWRSRRGQRGYTAVEVLISMTVFAIGASGVVAMQRMSVQGNYDARTLDVANSIARTWEERLQREGVVWTSPEAGGAGSLQDSTNWLRLAVRSNPQWISLPLPTAGSDPTGISPAFDLYGRDLDATHGAKSTFCTQIRLQWLSTDTRGGVMVPRTLRADVRVFWPRGTGKVAQCLQGDLDGAEGPAARPDLYRFVTVTSAIRGNFQ